MLSSVTSCASCFDQLRRRWLQLCTDKQLRLGNIGIAKIQKQHLTIGRDTNLEELYKALRGLAERKRPVIDWKSYIEST